MVMHEVWIRPVNRGLMEMPREKEDIEGGLLVCLFRRRLLCLRSECNMGGGK